MPRGSNTIPWNSPDLIPTHLITPHYKRHAGESLVSQYERIRQAKIRARERLDAGECPHKLIAEHERSTESERDINEQIVADNLTEHGKLVVYRSYLRRTAAGQVKHRAHLSAALRSRRAKRVEKLRSERKARRHLRRLVRNERRAAAAKARKVQSNLVQFLLRMQLSEKRQAAWLVAKKKRQERARVFRLNATSRRKRRSRRAFVASSERREMASRIARREIKVERAEIIAGIRALRARLKSATARLQACLLAERDVVVVKVEAARFDAKVARKAIKKKAYKRAPHIDKGAN